MQVLDNLNKTSQLAGIIDFGGGAIIFLKNHEAMLEQENECMMLDFE